MADNSAVMSALVLIAASPLLLGIMLITGVFAFGAMIPFLTSPWTIAAIILLLAVFYGVDRLNVATVVFSGIVVGLGFWLWGLIQFLSSPLGAICQIPIIGQLACGSITLVTLFTALPGYILGGLILSCVIGGFLMLIKK